MDGRPKYEIIISWRGSWSDRKLSLSSSLREKNLNWLRYAARPGWIWTSGASGYAGGNWLCFINPCPYWPFWKNSFACKVWIPGQCMCNRSNRGFMCNYAAGFGSYPGIWSGMEKSERKKSWPRSHWANVYNGRRRKSDFFIYAMLLWENRTSWGRNFHKVYRCRSFNGKCFYWSMGNWKWNYEENRFFRGCWKFESAFDQRSKLSDGGRLYCNWVYLWNPYPSETAGLLWSPGRDYPKDFWPGWECCYPVFCGWADPGAALFYPGN